MSFISQREVQGDGDTIAKAARAALREGPDVLVIEDLRAPEALVAALDAARAGRLVFGSISAATAPGAIERLIDAFLRIAGRRSGLRSRGACARWWRRSVPKSAGGRIAAREVLLSSPAVRKVILDGAIAQLPIAIESGRSLGMRTMVDASRRPRAQRHRRHQHGVREHTGSPRPRCRPSSATASTCRASRSEPDRGGNLESPAPASRCHRQGTASRGRSPRSHRHRRSRLPGIPRPARGAGIPPDGRTLKAESYFFKVFTPASSIRLASDRSPEEFIELSLDETSDPPAGTRPHHTRPREKDDEHRARDS